jgi:hypothetical protein
MTSSVVDRSPVFDLRADRFVAASPETAYSVVSDLPRSSEWSPECRGGTWISGDPSTEGAIFRGENLRSEDVVGWAPLIRGTWHTEARVVAAEPGRAFHWMMLSHAGDDQTSIWGFDVEPADGGCTLTHHHRMDVATAGIHSIVADLDEASRERFLTEWSGKIADDLAATLDRLKTIIEDETS